MSVVFEHVELKGAEAKFWVSSHSFLPAFQKQSFLSLLDNPPPTPLYGLVWKKQGECVGLAAFSIHSTTHCGSLYILAIREELRQDPTVRLFFHAIERLFQENGAQRCVIDFAEWDSGTAWLRSVLLEWGFSPPYLTATQYIFNALAFAPPWKRMVPHTYSSPDIEEFFWTDLTEREKKYVADLEKLLILPSYLSPFQKGKECEPMNSLGLRREDRVVGWMITQRESEKMLEYIALFVDPRFTVPLDALTLLVHSADRQQEVGSPPLACFCLSAQILSRSWRHFIQKRLEPYAIEIHPLYCAIKSLRYISSEISVY